MKYYVILSGEYSDIQIRGVTNNHDKAIKLSALYSTYDNPCYIEEYEEPEVLYEQYIDHLYYRIVFRDNSVIDDKCYCFFGRPDIQILDLGSYYEVNVKAINKREAIKKASDLLAKYQSLKIEYGKMIDDMTQCAKDKIEREGSK